MITTLTIASWKCSKTFHAGKTIFIITGHIDWRTSSLHLRNLGELEEPGAVHWWSECSSICEYEYPQYRSHFGSRYTSGRCALRSPFHTSSRASTYIGVCSVFDIFCYLHQVPLMWHILAGHPKYGTRKVYTAALQTRKVYTAALQAPQVVRRFAAPAPKA